MSRIVAIILGSVLIIGCLWWGGWQIYRANLDQQNQANHTSQQYQDATIAQERAYIQGYDTAADGAQKTQIKMTFCARYAEINIPPADLAAAHARIC